ncbi:LysR family transcriptional regulator [Undibacterium sp. Di27W]|uniref:LysR family transcriptional regulator n=1 Tax=Undibacterium sp. Di27W TaxID=3413036 RepID=UPI003BF089EB
MELRHLKYFIAVAEELHFTRAAERLHIGQPPLSHAIQMLEADIGAQLLERSKRWVRLTEAGKLFLKDARHILALAEQASENARRAQRGETGELRIGFTFSTPFTPLFAAVINSYRQQYPDVTLSLREMTTNKQLEALDQRSLDVGFIRPPEDGELARGVSSPLRFRKLREDALVAVLPSTHPLAKKKKVSMKDLAQESFIMYPPSAGTGIYPHILRLCRAAGYAPKIVQEANDASTIIGLVAAGCGVSVLIGSFYSIHFDGICYRPIADAGASTSLLLAQRKGEVSPLVEAFVSLAGELV